MTPRIALDLSLDGIAVLSRAPGGDGWWREGTVRLDEADMPERLSRLRDLAEARVGPDFTTILILPDSQLLFTSLECDDRQPEVTIRDLLKGRTPYPVEDLAFDYVERADRLQVAVVALETLLEAESFATEYGFRPVAVVANPSDSGFIGLPNFGKTGIADELLDGAKLDLDLGGGFRVSPAPAPPARPTSAAEDFTAAVAAPDTVDRPGGEAPAGVAPAPVPAPVSVPVKEPPGFSSSRRNAPPVPASDGARLAQVSPRLTATKAPTAHPGPPMPPRDEAASAPSPAPAAPIPVPVPDGAKPAAGKPKRPATASRTVPTSPPTRPQDAPPPANALGSMVARITRPADTTPAPAKDETARTAEAKALALPGLARDRAANPPRSSARLGLLLTLVLLATLVAVGVASFLLGPRDLAESPAAADAEVVILSAPVETVEPPEAEPDLAALLPDAAPDAGAPAGDAASPEPFVVTSATPVPVQSAEERAEADDPLADPDGVAEPGADLRANAAPDAAPAPGLDAAPAFDTAPPTFTEAFEGEVADASPEAPTPPAAQDVADIYVASIDPEIATGDAVSLPRAEPPTDGVAIQPNPAPAGTLFDTDAATGFVTPTPGGTLAPGGYTVVEGRPDVMPVPRAPAGGPANAAQDAADDAARQDLRRTPPTQRPGDSAELIERTQNNGLTRAELNRDRPTERPASVVASAEAASQAASAAQQAASASLAAATRAAVADAQESTALAAAQAASASAPTSASASALALPASSRPRDRPRSVERDAARIVTARRDQASTASTAAAPARTARTVDSGQQTVRSAGGNVASAATERNAIRLNEMNLIGVYGRSNARRALVRMSNGRYVKVEVGDRLDRGRVTAIGESELSYQRGGRSVVLRLPRA